MSSTPGASVDGVDLHARTFRIRVTSITNLPATDELLQSLSGRVPGGFTIEVSDTKGETIEVGKTGG